LSSVEDLSVRARNTKPSDTDWSFLDQILSSKQFGKNFCDSSNRAMEIRADVGVAEEKLDQAYGNLVIIDMEMKAKAKEPPSRDQLTIMRQAATAYASSEQYKDRVVVSQKRADFRLTLSSIIRRMYNEFVVPAVHKNVEGVLDQYKLATNETEIRVEITYDADVVPIISEFLEVANIPEKTEIDVAILSDAKAIFSNIGFVHSHLYTKVELSPENAARAQVMLKTLVPLKYRKMAGDAKDQDPCKPLYYTMCGLAKVVSDKALTDARQAITVDINTLGDGFAVAVAHTLGSITFNGAAETISALPADALKKMEAALACESKVTEALQLPGFGPSVVQKCLFGFRLLKFLTSVNSFRSLLPEKVDAVSWDTWKVALDNINTLLAPTKALEMFRDLHKDSLGQIGETNGYVQLPVDIAQVITDRSAWANAVANRIETTAVEHVSLGIALPLCFCCYAFAISPDTSFN
jgi:hypothetical protein